MFDPDSISPSKLNTLREAAEKAYGDDTRHEKFIGHPCACFGQCFVVSQWLTKHLGGHVGQKDGHHFWVSPDKRYAIDLTGDRFAYPPVHPDHEFGRDHEGVHQVDPEHKTWRAGPTVYKRTDHPLFKGFRVLDDHSEHPRAKQFARRADLALSGKRVSAVKVADLMGPSGLQTEQQAEDYDIQSLPFPMLHDEPGHNPANDPTQEHKWVFVNGQLHVSPIHSHEEMFSHAGSHPASNGPAAVGYVTVHQGRALWEVESNISLRGLHQVLQDYCVSLDTDILTRQGWKTHDQVQVGDETLGYNPLTARLEWTPVLAVHHNDESPIGILANTHWSACVTPNHRWVIRKKSKYQDRDGKTRRYIKEAMLETDYLGKDERIVTAAPFWNDQPNEITPDEAALIAWLYTDGSIHRTHGTKWVSATISQTKIAGRKELDALVERLPVHISVTESRIVRGKYSYYVPAEYIRDLLRRAGLWEGSEGLLPLVLTLSPDALEAFMFAVYMAEGTLDISGFNFSQNLGPKFDAFMLGAYLLGTSPSIAPNGDKCRNVFMRQRHAVETIGKTLTYTPHGVAPTWCVTTGLGSWTMRYQDQILLTGNSDTVGWDFDGMVGTNGHHLHDDFGPKQSMWYRLREDGHLVLSKRPLPNAHYIRIEGKTAYVRKPMIDDVSLLEWANDFGYRLAEFPGGGDMTDKMKTRENLDMFNRGDTDFQPERGNPDSVPEGNLRCGHCGEEFEDFDQLRLHERTHEPLDKEEIQDGHFPQIRDFDEPLGFGTHPQGTGWNSDQGFSTASVRGRLHRIAVHPLPTSVDCKRHPRFDLYSRLFGYDREEGHRFYGAYRDGQLVGYGAVRLNSEFERPDHSHSLADGRCRECETFWKKAAQEFEPEVLMIDAVQHGSGVGSAILSLMQRHFDSFYTHADSEAGERLMSRCGMVNVKDRRWRWAKGKEPKDLIEAPIPFVYDVNQNHVEIGYPGQKTHDITPRNLERFTPGGIVEGYYEPGGKVVLIPPMNSMHTTYGFGQAWYNRFPQMEITKLEEEMRDGQTHKIAAENVGNYVRRILPMHPAAQAAFHALRAAGGKVYGVGGVNRDALAGREPNDVDLMVSGLSAEAVKQALRTVGQTTGTGNLKDREDTDVEDKDERFGVFRLKHGGDEVEVALPRIDKYETGQRGKGVVTVDPNLPVEKDLERRDFTANSTATDLDTGEFIDPYGGAHDIQSNILRTTHPDSFREDPTRLIRALAMHGRFGLNPDERTRHEMEANAHLLRSESPDAINQTLTKGIFGANNGNPAGSIRLAHETGVLPHLFPELAENFHYDQNNPHHNYRLGEHSLHVLDNVSRLSNDADLRFAALYHDVGKPASAWVDPTTGYSHYYPGPNGQGADHAHVGARMAYDRMRAYNYPVSRINRVTHLIHNHMFPAFSSGKGARKFLQRVGDEHADDLLHLREADMGGKGVTPEEMAAKTSANTMRQLVDESRKQQAPTDLSNLALNGNDLISLGMKPGPQIGNVLRQLLDDVVQEPTLNQRDLLLARAQQYINAQPS